MRYMIRYSEIGLKSRPVRTRMVNLLKRNILDHLEAAGLAGKVRSDGGHLYLLTDEPADRILARTFGTGYWHARSASVPSAGPRIRPTTRRTSPCWRWR